MAEVLFVLIFFSNVFLALGAPLITNRIFFDVSLGGENIGRIQVGLYGDIVPPTVCLS
jgi:hypothetical protein